MESLRNGRKERENVNNIGESDEQKFLIMVYREKIPSRTCIFNDMRPVYGEIKCRQFIVLLYIFKGKLIIIHFIISPIEASARILVHCTISRVQ